MLPLTQFGAAECWQQLRQGNLTHLTIGYLALPLLLFLFGWLELYYAVPLVALLVLLLVRWGGDISAVVRPDPRTVLLCGLIALLWTSLSGAGGVGLQNFDYQKHNAMLKALTLSEWPVRMGEDAALVFTIGYYLPGAAVGKLVHWLATGLKHQRRGQYHREYRRLDCY